MNELLKTALSLSLSGSLLILTLLLCRPLLKNRISKRWQYYIWLVVIARLLLPFAPEVNLMGTIFHETEQHMAQPSQSLTAGLEPASLPLPEKPSGTGGETASSSRTAPAAGFIRMARAAQEYLWVVWLGVAAALLIRKITVYQSFSHYVRAGQEEVSDIVLLDRLAQAGEQVGVKRPVELYTNSLISSPLLIGIFRPRIILPDAGLPDAQFLYTVRHELTHWKRRDMLYKWLVQITICLHWFNPLVWRMGREVSRACELSCDEAVIASLDGPGRRAYGETLLCAMESGGHYQNSLASITLNESVELLKERLDAIMRFKKGSIWTALLSLLLTAVLTVGAAAAGAYPVFANTSPNLGAALKKGTQSIAKASGSSAASRVKRFYEEGSLPLFQIVFPRLGEKEQEVWLNKIYKDNNIAFFGAAVNQLDEDSPLMQRLAEKIYKDDSIAFFSVLANQMDEEQLERWLDRSMDDKKWVFQFNLFNLLDDNWDEKDWESSKWDKDAFEKEWEEAQLKDYQPYGITREGKHYYYQGQPTYVFLDIRANKSFYTLEVNPAGTVSVKVTRSEDGKIKSVVPMTEAEVIELVGDLSDEDDWEDGEEIEIPVDIAKVKDGEYVWLGTYTLSEDDQVYYDIFAESGKRLDVGFAKAGQAAPGATYCTVSNRLTDGKLEVESGPMPWKGIKSGEYRLFVHTAGGALTNVEGCVTIIKAG